MSKEIDDHIRKIYNIHKLLGSGAYGYVWKAVDKATSNPCAVKKVFDAFRNNVDAQRTYREITLLHQLDHPNIVKLHRLIKDNNHKDLYLTFEHI